ncbi:MAG: hypothetical protein AB7F40_10970 [Victivallaceae bacterium]|nr:hypothetical protein [Victivallaceae bacterium]
MKKIAALILTAALAVVSGCRVVPSGPEPKPVPEAVNASAVKLGGELLSAIRCRDFAAFCKIAPEQMKPELDKAKFDASADQFKAEYGELEDFEFLTMLDTPGVANAVWKVGFRRNDADGHAVRRELLFRVVVAELDGKTEILSFGFF